MARESEKGVEKGVGPSQVLVLARNAAKRGGKIGVISVFLMAKGGK
jgi:hypothetical protein